MKNTEYLSDETLHCLAAKILSRFVELASDQLNQPETEVWRNLLSTQDVEFYSGMLGVDGEPLSFEQFLDNHDIIPESFCDTYLQESLAIIAEDNGFVRVHPQFFPYNPPLPPVFRG